MSEWVTVNIGGKIVRRKVPAGSSDAQVRQIMAPVMRQYGVDTRQQAVLDQRTKPQSNQEYWRERLKDQGDLKPGADTIRSRIARTATGLARSIATDTQHAGRIGENVASVMDWVPGIGDTMGAQEAAQDFKRGWTTGDYATAGGAALAGLLSLAPGNADKPIRRKIGDLFRDESGAIRAWHGSPYDFDKFDAGKIGTGEGNQAYGRGLYFAESPGVAGSYVQPRNNEPLDVPEEVRSRLRQALKSQDYLGFDTFSEAIHAVRTNLRDFEKAWEVDNADEIRGALEAYDSARWPQGNRPRLYEVEIDAEPEDFVDYDALGAANARRAASEPGVKGIKFLDGDSRHLGGKSYNYVVKDPSLLKILNKY